MPRGGVREGSGGKKPKLPPGKKKIMISVKIDPKLRAWLKRQNNQARTVENALRDYRKQK